MLAEGFYRAPASFYGPERSSRLGLGPHQRGDGQAALDLRDVDPQLALLAGQRLLELGKLFLAAVELVLAHLQVDVRPHLARLELLLAPGHVFEAVLNERLVVVQPLLPMLDPARGLSRGLGAQEIALGIDDLALALGEELLLGAKPVAAIGGEPLALGELGLGLDELGRPFAELAGLLP